MKNKIQPKLGERELDIMQVLWQRDAATVAEVQQALIDQGEKIAYTTVQTMLGRLDAKGLVERDNSDRAHSYRAVLEQPSAADNALSRVIERFFSGSTEALVTRLVEKDLSGDELERTQSLIDEQRRRKGAGRRKGARE